MATHSSFLPWRIPWTEEPGWLWSVGLEEMEMSEMTLYQDALPLAMRMET